MAGWPTPRRKPPACSGWNLTSSGTSAGAAALPQALSSVEGSATRATTCLVTCKSAESQQKKMVDRVEKSAWRPSGREFDRKQQGRKISSIADGRLIKSLKMQQEEGIIMSAWVFQDQKQVEKNGEAAAAWSVGWYDPEGKRRCKSCGPGSEGKRNAEKLRKKIDAELLTGTYRSNDKKTWEEFREEYDRRILAGLAIRSRDEARTALGHFERLVGPKRIAILKTQHVDDYVSARRGEPGKKTGDTVSPATVNKELR